MYRHNFAVSLNVIHTQEAHRAWNSTQTRRLRTSLVHFMVLACSYIHACRVAFLHSHTAHLEQHPQER